MKPIITLLFFFTALFTYGQNDKMVIGAIEARALNIPEQYINANGKVLVTSDYYSQLTSGESNLVDPPEINGWPVNDIQGTPQRASRYVDLDMDGSYELVFNTGSLVQVYGIDGQPKIGWPASVGSDPLEGAPSVANIDDDPELEIVVHTTFFGTRGGLYAFDHDGTLKSGFPVLWPNGGPQKEPLLENIDADPEMEIISHVNNFPTSFVYGYNGDGTLDPNWSNIELDYIPGSGASSGDITGDGIPEIIACTYWKLYVFDLDGQVLSGFPFTFEQDVRGVSYSNPVIADIDEDGLQEVIVATVNEAPVTDSGAVYVLNNDGTLVNGWPRYLFYWPFAPVSVADFDQDNHLDLIVGDQILSPTPTNRLNAWDKDGNLLSGFPRTGLPAINIQGSIGDFDGNGDLEIIVDNNINNQPFQMFNHDGTDFTGFTLNPSGASFFNTALLSDINFDGNLNLMVATADFNVFTTDMHIYDLGVSFDQNLIPLGTHQYNLRNTGEYGNQDILSTGDVEGSTTLNSVYPNPFDRVLNIQGCENLGQNAVFELFDMAGRKVLSSPLSENTCALELPSSLETGMYSYRLINNGTTALTGKLIRK